MARVQAAPLPLTKPFLTEPSPGVRTIGQADLNWALAEGWRDFQAKRGELLMLAVIYPLVAFLAFAVSFDYQLFPLFFPMVAGLSILGPAVASGFYELARRREAGLDSGWRHFVDPLRGRSRFSLAVLTGGLLAMFAVWMIVASLIYNLTLGASAPQGSSAGASEFFRRLFTTPQGWTMIVLGNLVGGLFAVATLVVGFVSFPMIVDKPVDPATAVVTSVRAVTKNPATVATWGCWVAVLLALGCLPAFIGLAVVLPVLGYASWHLYTRLVDR